MRNLSGEKGTILVVDDEASIRRILQTRLEMIGYSVVTASDGEEALSAFRLLAPDLIVLDVMMPKLDGYGVCQELRKESDVPIIMLTEERRCSRPNQTNSQFAIRSYYPTSKGGGKS